MSEAGVIAALGAPAALPYGQSCRSGKTNRGHGWPSYAPACNINPYTKGVSHMHAAANNLRGGGIS